MSGRYDDAPTEDPPPLDAAARIERIERTGIALVHEGEYVLAEAAGTARLAPSPPPGPQDGSQEPAAEVEEVHYWFPVEIEVVGAADPELADAIVARVFEELRRELASRQ